MVERLLGPCSAERVWPIAKEAEAERLWWRLRGSAQLRLEMPRAVPCLVKWQKPRQSVEWGVRLLLLARRIPMAESTQTTLAAARLACLEMRLNVAAILIEVERGRWVMQ